MSDSIEKIVAEMREQARGTCARQVGFDVHLSSWADRLDSLRQVPEASVREHLNDLDMEISSGRERPELSMHGPTCIMFASLLKRSRDMIARLANTAPPTSGICYRPEQGCPSPASCRENGCNAVERENLKATPAQAGEELPEPVKCSHANTSAGYDYASCLDCGAFRTDSGWGIAKCRWFANREEAVFYRKNGRLPENLK